MCLFALDLLILEVVFPLRLGIMDEELIRNWAKMRISKDEETIVGFDGDDPGFNRISEKMDCLAIDRLVNGKTANITGLRWSLDRAWRLQGDLAISGLEDGLLGFQFSNPFDRERILQGRPWFFDDVLLCLEPARADYQPADMDFSKSLFWVQAYDVPFGMRSSSYAKKIGDLMGGFIEADERGSMQNGCSLRFKILMDLQKPLRRGMRIELRDGSTKWITFKYERLGFFCYRCGIIGHPEKACSTRTFATDSTNDLPYGSWIRAPPKIQGWLRLRYQTRKPTGFS